MPIATPRSTPRCSTGRRPAFAYPAINVTSSQTLNAAIRGFAEAESDGIIQVSTGGAEYRSGTAVKDMVTGAVALAEFAHVVAAKYDVNIALHTDHCPKDKLDGYVRPLLAISAGAGGQGPGPAVPVAHVGRLGRAARREPARSRRSC
jgi:fructose-bisphosphate aldolase class II